MHRRRLTGGEGFAAAKVAYRYEDEAAYGTFQRFADASGAPRSDCDTVLAGVSLAAPFGQRVTGRTGYQGCFGSGLRYSFSARRGNPVDKNPTGSLSARSYLPDETFRPFGRVPRWRNW